MARRWFTAAGAALLAAGACLLGSHGCGGAGAGIATLGISELVGTAAGGRAFGNATVTIRGANGAAVTVTTNPITGTYTANVAGLSAPFLLQVATGTSVLFSVGSQAGTVNIHPYTDLIVRSYFQATGQNLAAVFGNPALATALPTPVEVRTIAAVVRTVIGNWLQSVAHVDAASFDLISGTLTATVSSTPATATGLDQLLDLTTIVGSSITIDGSAIGLAQTTTASVSGSGGAISGGGTTTTNGTQTSTVSSTAQVQTTTTGGDRQQAAVDGVTVLFQQFGAVLTRIPTATAADLLPLFDADYLNGGRKAANEAADFVGMAGLIQFRVVSVDRVVSFHDDLQNPANQTLNLVFTILIESTGNAPATQQVTNKGSTSDGFTFKNQGNGTWKMYGDRKFAETEVRLTALRDYGQGDSRNLEVSTRLLPGAITAATVSGSPGGGPLSLQGGLNAYGVEEWVRSSTPPSFPATGTVYTFSLTPSPTAQSVYAAMPTSGATTYDFTVGSATDERVDIVSYSCPTVNGGQLTSRAAFHAAVTSVATQLAGQRLTVVFQHPSTFAVNELNFAVQDSNNRSHVNLAGDATMGVVTVPASFTQLTVDIQFFGFGGELSEVRDSF